jgi:amidase
VKKQRIRVPLGGTLILAMSLALVAVPVAAQTGSTVAGSAATVVPPTDEPLGTSYAEWGANWWQWLFSVPFLLDPEVGDCQAGQGGEVFYIPHVPPGVSATTDCTIGTDQWILASAGGTYADNSPPTSATTPDEVLALVEAETPTYSGPSVSIDGEAVADIESYWVTNPAFMVEWSADNPVGFAEGTWDAAMAGWFVMIPPLEPGSHTIVVGDYIDDPADEEGPVLAELTANVTVAALLGDALGSAAPALAVEPPPAMVGGIDLETTTIPELQARMNEGRLSSVELVQFYLDRIEVLNPDLHAVITTNPNALDEAQAADDARTAGTALPLLGIPILVKDNIGTTGMPTTAGSYALADSMPPDAFVVSQLRDAGAVILGKANLSEWANIRAYPTSSGWSAIGGQTNNPYALDRNPCGSSSGSAAAVAANMATAAVGTETDGSIICPASQSGVVGVKPSLGLVGRTGIVPISSQQDTAGPITRNVTDAAVLLGAMIGADPSDPMTADADISGMNDFTSYLDTSALEGARIGVWREGAFGLDSRVDMVMEGTIDRLKALGAEMVDPADLAVDDVYDPEFVAMLAEFKHEIGLYLETLPQDGPKTLQDLIDFNLETADLEMQYFGQETFEEAQAALDITDPAYLEAREGATRIAQAAIDELMAANDLDAIITPSNDPAWLTDLENGDGGVMYTSAPAAVAGYSTLTVPAGYVDGLPIGVSFIGGKDSEATLLALAYAWEQATDVRVPPTMPESVQLREPEAPAE